MEEKTVSHSMLDLIGNTPLVEIQKLNPNPNVKIYAKLEYLNPGGSCKDRPALYMINAGEKSGELTPDKTVIEATSGNTGIGLAMVCAIKGYKIILTMSEAVSLERQKILKARGADIILTDGSLGTDGAIEAVYKLARENPESYFMTDQYNNDANWKAHYYTTAEEIWKDTNGEVTDVVATMGTTGTLMGVSRRLKEYNENIKIIGVEPFLGHKIQGLKNMMEAYQPELFEKKRLDKKINIEDEDAFEMTRLLAKEEGLFVGMSSGAAMAIAIQYAKTLDKGNIVVILPDSGERYLSTSVFTFVNKTNLTLYNTMNRQKQLFEPLESGKATIYSCGPTVYRRMNLGECRRFIFADLLCRYLQYRDFSVSHIVNITDLDDKTIAESEKTGELLSKFTDKYINEFKQDLAFLDIMPASCYPRVTDHLNEMISVSEKLVDKGAAYEKHRSVYFDISKESDYGKLSGVDIDKIRIGATVDLDEYEKENPRDFTLLKKARLTELKRDVCVKTKWGVVRPSLHLQCAAISMKYLGDTFDIHTSSRDLVFPHHENELAIAHALTGKPLARYWVHCDRVMDDPGFNLTELTEKGFTAREIRFWLLSTHYRKPIHFSEDRLHDARRSLKKIDDCVRLLLNIKNGEKYQNLEQLLYDIKYGVISAMDNDLNIATCMASLFNTIKQLNILIQKKEINQADANGVIDAFKKIDKVLKIFNFDLKVNAPEVAELLLKRDNARHKKDWVLADKLRKELNNLGVTLMDDKS
ncbi:MAG: cysteine--tRNA ligase [Desulfobacteraceae bacterium 4572_19]|nr:MAG: cysteine--tRNA ligase [Desulfobacteraceae bacterium 4572_19]